MDEEKQKRQAAAGYVSITVADFLGLTPEQSELIEIKLTLTDALSVQRKTSGLSQGELAEKIGSSQSRIAKMERGDPHVSLDLMIRALLAAGMTRRQLAEVIAGEQPAASEEPTPPPLQNGTPRRRAGKSHARTPEVVEA